MVEISQVLRQRYQIIKFLGSGGFGETYMAIDTDRKNDFCVVKCFKPQTENLEELKIAKRLFDEESDHLYSLGEHDQIPRLCANFEENGEFFLVQEFIDGENLCAEIIQGKPWLIQDVIRLLVEILEVLEIAHRQGKIHRDIKPANLMRRKIDGKIILIDFGAVKQIKNTNNKSLFSTVSKTISIGSPGYQASEQAMGYPQLASDIYAVGMVGLQALTGVFPVQLVNPKGEVSWKSFVEERIGSELTDVLNRMVAYRADDRYKDATTALAALRKFDQQGLLFNLDKIPPGSGLNLSSKKHSNFISEYPEKPETEENFSMHKTIYFETAKLVRVRQYYTDVEFQRRKNLIFGWRNESVRVSKERDILEIQFYTCKREFFTDVFKDNVSFDMIAISSGEFVMGSPSNIHHCSESESPQHRVKVQPFYMSKNLITQSQYESVMGYVPSYFNGDNLPVDSVSWNDAKAFCKKLSAELNKKYRLPSEAEWEYACRSETNTAFYFGETLNHELANYDCSLAYADGSKSPSMGKTVNVGSFPPNAYGLYDMHGNVWEWCEDEWHGTYRYAPQDGSAWSASGDTSHYSLRVLRGGSWNSDPKDCRSSARTRDSADSRKNSYGFRIACSLSDVI